MGATAVVGSSPHPVSAAIKRVSNEKGVNPVLCQLLLEARHGAFIPVEGEAVVGGGGGWTFFSG